MPCTISINRLGIKTRALINTRANGFIFLNSPLAREASRYLDTNIRTLEHPYLVKGFDGQKADPITQYLELNLHISGRKQLKLPMLIVKLGGQDMIIGRAWAAKYNTLIDCKNRQLLWPDDLPESKGWNKVLATHQKNLFPPVNQEHQKDAQRRDQLLAKDSWRPQRILRRTWKTDQKQEYQKMDQDLKGDPLKRQPKPTKLELRPEAKPTSPTIDICGISAVAFDLNLRRKENTYFTTSLYEIDRILEEHKETETLDEHDH